MRRFQKFHTSGWKVRVLTLNSLGAHLLPGDVPPPCFARLPDTKKSDWVRLYMVSTYGGVWCDASIILTKPLEWIITKADFVGYHMDGWQSEGMPKIVESWCFGAPRGSPFVTAWFEEFDRAMRTGDLNAYVDAVAPTLDLMNFPKAFLSHLAVYVSAQRVLQAEGADYNLDLRPSQDGPFSTAAAVKWDADVLADVLATSPTPPHIEMIKLTGEMRKAVDARLIRHGAMANSTLGILFCNDDASNGRGGHHQKSRAPRGSHRPQVPPPLKMALNAPVVVPKTWTAPMDPSMQSYRQQASQMHSTTQVGYMHPAAHESMGAYTQQTPAMVPAASPTQFHTA